MDNETYFSDRRDSSITDTAEHSRESHPSHQYTTVQDQHSFSGPAGNYNSTATGDVASLGSMPYRTLTRSNITSPTSFASDAMTDDTALISRTSLGSSSHAHSTAFGDYNQETAADATSTQSTSATPKTATPKTATPKTATPKTAMFCVCCWIPIRDLTRHYRESCSYIRGDWAFWACPYTLQTLKTEEAFINHITSFKPAKKRIEVTKTIYVTAWDWAMNFSQEAKKRQLVNTVFEYFDANPGMAKSWKLVPDLNNVADVSEILNRSSILRRRPPPGSGRIVEKVFIDQLRQVFQTGTKTGRKIRTRPGVSSHNPGHTNTSLTYTALRIIDRDTRVAIGDVHFDAFKVAEQQRQQLGEQNQERSLHSGGGVLHSPSDVENLAPASTSPTARTPSAFEDQSQGAYAAQNNVSDTPAEVQYGPQDDLMDDIDFELPSPKSTDLLAGANDLLGAFDDELDLDFYSSLVNDSALWMDTFPQHPSSQASQATWAESTLPL